MKLQAIPLRLTIKAIDETSSIKNIAQFNENKNSKHTLNSQVK